MIVRILGEGQFEIPDGRVESVRHLDEGLLDAVEHDDENGFRHLLGELVSAIRSEGLALSNAHMGPSDLVLPGEGATLAEVRDLLRSGHPTEPA